MNLLRVDRRSDRPPLAHRDGWRAVRAPRLCRVLLAAVATSLAGCARQTPPGPAVELTLAQSSVEVLRGDSATVQVTLTRSGAATEPARFSLGGTVPSGVTATFDPAELTGAQLVTELTFAVDAGVAPVALGLEVVVDVGELSSSKALVLEVEGLTVSGRVEDVYGRPLGGGRAGSQGQVVPVDADGAFLLTNLSVPYDLMVGSGPEGRLHVFEGLRDERPVVVPFRVLDEPVGDAYAGLSGSVLAGAQLAEDEGVLICAEGHEVVIYFCQRLETGADGYAFNVTWYGAPNQPATLHALHYDQGVDESTSGFLGYDSLDVELVDGAAIAWDLAFEPLGAATLEGEIARGTGAAGGPLLTAAAWRAGENLSLVVDIAFDQAELSLLVPDLPGGSESFDLFVTDGFEGESSAVAWRSGLAGDAGLVALRDVPSVTGPAAGETGVGSETEFGVTGLEGQVKTFLWSSATSSKPMIALTTMRDGVTIPDPAALNLGGMLPQGSELDWRVLSSFGTDVDGATADVRRLTSMVLALFDFGRPPEGEGDQVTVGGEAFVFGQ